MFIRRLEILEMRNLFAVKHYFIGLLLKVIKSKNVKILFVRPAVVYSKEVYRVKMLFLTLF